MTEAIKRLGTEFAYILDGVSSILVDGVISIVKPSSTPDPANPAVSLSEDAVAIGEDLHIVLRREYVEAKEEHETAESGAS